MNLVFKSINKEKTSAREFRVTIAKDLNFGIIYEYSSAYESFLPDLVYGIKSMSTEDVTIYCSEDALYAEVSNLKRLKLTDDKIEVMEPNLVITPPLE